MTELKSFEFTQDSVDPNTLVDYDKNAKEHPEDQIATLARVILEHGFDQPIVVWKDNIIIKGHGRKYAAIRANEMIRADCALKGKKYLPLSVPIIRREDLTLEESISLRLSDNALNRTGFNQEMLQKDFQLLNDVGFDLSLTGFAEDEYLKLLNAGPVGSLGEGQSPGTGKDPDEVPENVPAVCQRGNIWQLGRHRLMCGDSTSKDEVAKLMDGSKADLVFTDPPYNINYIPEDRAKGGREKNELGGIKNDSMTTANFETFLTAVFEAIDANTKEGSGIYLCSPVGFELKEYLDAWEKMPWKYQAGLVWNKNNHSISRFDYHPKHEIIHYGWKQGAAHRWEGARDQFTVWNISRDYGSDYKHPTQKPVAIPETAILNSSKPRDLVLDTFGGSGSTLVACEMNGRVCSTMELDPKYCDVIIARWEGITGSKATLLG